MKWCFALSVTAALLCLCRPARADIITADENGNATIMEHNGAVPAGYLPPVPLTFTIGQDTGPGGLANALIYTLPFGPGLFQGSAVGDVLVTDGVGGPLSDVIRFNSTGNTMIIYSAAPGSSLADVGFPSAFYGNQVTVAEINGQITYTAASIGEYGDRNGFPPTYQITSDAPAPTPEPSSMIICGIGGLILAGYYKWRIRRST
jgi:hypothetical protein